MSELRFYTFVNFYLSSLQQGVQSFHVCHEMFMKYRIEEEDDACHGPSGTISNPSSAAMRLYDWANHHKTVIVLNGGANQDILDKYIFLSREAEAFSFPAPFTSFSEDDYSLGGVMTAVGIVLPEEIYNAINLTTAWRMVKAIYPEKSTDFLNEAEYTYYFIKDGKIINRYPKDCPEWRLISMLKACQLAR
jgi:hypothetical protein